MNLSSAETLHARGGVIALLAVVAAGATAYIMRDQPHPELALSLGLACLPAAGFVLCGHSYRRSRVRHHSRYMALVPSFVAGIWICLGLMGVILLHLEPPPELGIQLLFFFHGVGFVGLLLAFGLQVIMPPPPARPHDPLGDDPDPQKVSERIGRIREAVGDGAHAADLTSVFSRLEAVNWAAAGIAGQDLVSDLIALERCATRGPESAVADAIRMVEVALTRVEA